MDHVADVALPLRLAAEPYAKQCISSSCVSLGIPSQISGLEISALCDDDGIHAFCVSELLSRTSLLDTIHSAIRCSSSTVEAETIATTSWNTKSLFVLVRVSTASNLMKWHVFQENENEAVPVDNDNEVKQYFETHQATHTIFVAELITNSIRNYYSRQILEPSVRGFLSVLEKQFGRSDLYLFELLQNAVDDGASVVEFKATRDGSALSLIHNGRQFTPLDLLGLSSVGLSTKSRQGKRTIGFMGVGFKSVYKRFAKVTIDDGTYHFVYQEPHNNNHGYGWVMLPIWQKQRDLTVKIKQGDDDSRDDWCRFLLERPRGGQGKILKDLAVLPRTAPPLLGRASLIKMASTNETGNNSWILDWNGKRHTIQRSNIVKYDNVNSSEMINVDITDTARGITRQQQQQKWLFVSHQYTPSVSAIEAYKNHTKRQHTGSEEVCGFIQLGDDNVPSFYYSSNNKSNTSTSAATTTRSIANGIVHSVLPTKIRMPIPMNIQGSLLLSVDRQSVQDLTDNAWNSDILKQFPELIANFFRWAAVNKLNTASHYVAICQLLPSISFINNESKVTTTKGDAVADILGQLISLNALVSAFWSERILPVGLSKSKIEANSIPSMKVENEVSASISDKVDVSTGYYEGEKSIWVPPSFFKFLDSDFLQNWLGKRPLRTDLMGGDAFHPIFSFGSVLNQLSPLPCRNHQLAEAIGIRSGRLQRDSVWKIIRLMAAIGSSYDEHPDYKGSTDGMSNAQSKQQKSKKSNNKGKEEEKSIDSLAPSIPRYTNDWSVFVTENGNIARLDQIILPAEDFSLLPSELASLLRPFLRMDSKTSSRETSQQYNNNYNNNNKYNGKRDKKRARTPPPPRIERLHNLLEDAISHVDNSTAPDEFITENIQNWEEVLKHAASFLNRARIELPSNVVNVATAATNILQSYLKLHNLNEEQISAVKLISRFALESSNHLLFNYVLVDIPGNGSHAPTEISTTRLVLATEAYIGKAVDETGPGAHLENFAGPKLQYISSRYNSILDAKPSITRNKLIHLFALAGVQTGISVSISVVDIQKDKRLLNEVLSKVSDRRLPSLRKNNTKSEIHLPYGLGVVMNKKKHYLIDSQIPSEWERLIMTMSPVSSIGFISLLLSMPFENSINVTSSTVVAAAKCLAGQGDDTEENSSPANATHTVRLSKNTSAPLRRRLFFLPPGQAGAKGLDISESLLIEQLQSINWLPCLMPSDHQAILLPPSKTLLEADATRPEMPIVDLPTPLMKRLKSSTIANAFTWGTVAPPPPVGELSQLAKEAKLLLSSDRERIDKDSISMVSSRMLHCWKQICKSHLRDGLSPADMRALRMLHSSYCIPVRRVLDSGGSSNWIVTRSRCVRMPDAVPTSNSEEDDLKSLTVTSMVASNFMCDFNHSVHNPFFHQPEISKAVIELIGMPTLAEFNTRSLIDACGSFVRYCCTEEPMLTSRLSPLRDSFSYSMKWCLESQEELLKRDGGLKLWVRHGPGIGAKALPARWVPLKGGVVQAVVDDSRVRSALLSPEMNIQVLGVLDHSENEKECTNAKLLSVIDKEVVRACGILRLSDSRFTVKTRARGTPVIVVGAATKLQLIFAILREMEIDRHSNTSTTSTAENTFLSTAYEPFVIARHESLIREFKAPQMDAPSLIHLYAMFGKAPKLSKKRCILVSGEPDDYSMELEELVLDHVNIRSAASLTHLKPYRAAVRLLSHIENESSFKKFVERDFADFEATSAWKALMKRKEIIHKLSAAKNIKDRIALRDLLIEAEEAFENDPDGGDAVLQNARDLLVRLEEEANEATKRQQKEREEIERNTELQLGEEAPVDSGQGRGRGRCLPAWMTSTESTTLGQDAQTACASVGESTAVTGELTETKINHATARLEDLGDPSLGTMGRGRGISNLPAWMSSKTTISSEESETKPEDAAVRLGKDSPLGDTSLGGMGRGRGVSNLPAWVTSDATNLPSVEKELVVDDKVFTTAEDEAKSLVSTILSSNPGSNVVEIRQQQTARVGEGCRGVSNLPAWMTNPSSSGLATENAPKRKRSESDLGEFIADETTRLKMPRQSTETYELTLKHEMEPTKESDFMVWLQPRIEEEIANRGGSLISIAARRADSSNK
jgi:hypothetical protein